MGSSDPPLHILENRVLEFRPRKNLYLPLHSFNQHILKVVSVPNSHISASSRVTPSLFPIKTEKEFIVSKMKLKVLFSRPVDYDDGGNPIYPITVKAEVI